MIKQYVNLNPDDPAELGEGPHQVLKKRAGRTVELRAKVSPARENVSVEFWFQPGGNNASFGVSDELKSIAAWAKGQGVDPIVTHWLGSTARDTKCRRVTDSSGVAAATLVLGGGGLDSFVVKAAVLNPDGTRGAEVQLSEIQAWKRLYASITRLGKGLVARGRPGEANLPYVRLLPEVSELPTSELEAELAKLGIELVVESQAPTGLRTVNVMEHTKREHYSITARDGYTESHGRVGVRVVHAFDISKVGESLFKGRFTAPESDALRPEWGLSFRVGTTPVEDETLPGNTDWLLSCAIVDVRDPLVEGRPVLRRVPVELVERTGERSMRVTLGEWIRTEGLGGQSLKVFVHYRSVDGRLNGLQWGRAVWVASHYTAGAPRPDADRKATLTHELGHYIHLTSPLQSTHYSGKGHQGSHCSTGLPANLSDYKGKRGACVMFGEGHSSRSHAFCIECTKAGKRSTAVRPGANPW